MTQTTQLSTGQLNGQTFTIELVEPGSHRPPAVVVRWPEKPSVCPPGSFDPARRGGDATARQRFR
jgi:hypothetical protein